MRRFSCKFAFRAGFSVVICFRAGCQRARNANPAERDARNANPAESVARNANPTEAHGVQSQETMGKIHGSVTRLGSIVLTNAYYAEFAQKRKLLSAKLLTLFVQRPSS